MALHVALRQRVPEPVAQYAHGLAISVMHNVPAFGFSIVVSATRIAATVELRRPTAFGAFLFLPGAAAAFAFVGALAALAIEDEQIKEPGPRTVFVGSVLSVVSTSAGFGAGLLVAANLSGRAAWLLSAFCATLTYVLVLALEVEIARLFGRPAAS